MFIYTKAVKFQFPYCVGKFNWVDGSGYSWEDISIPVLRGEVQRLDLLLITKISRISIPVLRGEVQPSEYLNNQNHQEFQFPYCVGKFNMNDTFQVDYLPEFQFPYCVGKFNIKLSSEQIRILISIPVLRGEVQPVSKLYTSIVS